MTPSHLVITIVLLAVVCIAEYVWLERLAERDREDDSEVEDNLLAVWEKSGRSK